MIYNITHTLKELSEVVTALQIAFGNKYSAEISDKDGAIHISVADQELANDDIFNDVSSVLPDGYSVYCNEGITIYSNRVEQLFYLTEESGHYIITSDSEEAALRVLFATPEATIEQLSLIYNYLTGKEVIDYRDTHDNEYTNVAAQSDPDFWEEEAINDINYKISKI